MVRILTFWKKKELVKEHDHGLEFLNLQDFLKREFLSPEEFAELERLPGTP